MIKAGTTSPLLLASILFVSGLIVGILAVRVLSADEKAELLSYLEVFMRGLNSPGLDRHVVFRLSLIQNLKTAALLWALGLAIIGMPAVCLWLLVRGFSFGFSAAFVVREVSSGGPLIFLGGMLPHSILWIPALVVLAANSMAFSLLLVEKRPWAYGGVWKLALDYSLRCVILCIGLLLSSLVEAYLSPAMLARVVTR